MPTTYELLEREIDNRFDYKAMLYHSATMDEIVDALKERVAKEVLVHNHGNQTQTAKDLGMNRGTLRKVLGVAK